MRPRIKEKDDIKITYSEMNKYLTENKCYGHVVKFLSKDIAEYSFFIMYRHSRKPPELATIRVSLVSKLVLSAAIEGRVFNSIRAFMEACKWPE